MTGEHTPYTYTCTYIYIYIHIYTYIYIHIHKHTYIHTYIQSAGIAHDWGAHTIYIYMYIYIHIHKHTYIHTCIQSAGIAHDWGAHTIPAGALHNFIGPELSGQNLTTSSQNNVLTVEVNITTFGKGQICA